MSCNARETSGRKHPHGTKPATAFALRHRIAVALCLNDDGPCGVCWAAAGDVLPVVLDATRGRDE